MHLAVISTIAAVLTVIVPFVSPDFTESTVVELKEELRDPDNKRAIRDELKSLPGELDLPPLPGSSETS